MPRLRVHLSLSLRLSCRLALALCFATGAAGQTPSADLPAPALHTPVDGAYDAPLDPLLDWWAVPGATAYVVQIDDEPTFLPPYVAHRELVGGGAYERYSRSEEAPALRLVDPDADASAVRPTALGVGLATRTTYYWRVRAVGASGRTASAWSATHAFTTGDAPVSPPSAAQRLTPGGAPVFVDPASASRTDAMRFRPRARPETTGFASANGDTVVLDFEGFAPGFFTTQYADDYGVVFEGTEQVEGPYLLADSASAHSGQNALTAVGEPGVVRAVFTAPLGWVGVQVSGFVPTVFSCFDGAGALVGSDTLAGQPGGDGRYPYERVDITGSDIRSCTFGYASPGGPTAVSSIVDDLTFVHASDPPVDPLALYRPAEGAADIDIEAPAAFEWFPPPFEVVAYELVFYLDAPDVAFCGEQGGGTYWLRGFTTWGFREIAPGDSVVSHEIDPADLAESFYPGYTYHWCVRALVDDPGSPFATLATWSDARAFTTLADLADAPTGLRPDAAAFPEDDGVDPTAVEFAWTMLPGAPSGLTFDVQLWSGDDPHVPGSLYDYGYHVDTTGVASPLAAPALVYGTAYTWRVRARGAADEVSAWTEAGFSTGSSGGVPLSLLTPADGAEAVDPTTFTWSAVAGAQHYEFQLYADPDAPDSTLLHAASGLLDAAYPGAGDPNPLDALAVDSVYYWRVRACLAAACDPETPWTEPFAFRLVEAWSAPPLLGLLDGAAEVSTGYPVPVGSPALPPILAWEAPIAAADYTLALVSADTLPPPGIDLDSLFADAETIAVTENVFVTLGVDSLLDDPALFDPLTPEQRTAAYGALLGRAGEPGAVLAGGRTYVWRVRVEREGVAGRWSEAWHFRTEPARAARRYYLTDHLGSVRAVVDERGAVVHYADYYPFGLQLPGRSFVAGTPTRENFTGHERDDETGLLYAGARYYDPVTGRWSVVDGLAEKHADWSPYNYVLDNPLQLVDPDGKQVSSVYNQLISTTENVAALAGDAAAQQRLKTRATLFAVGAIGVVAAAYSGPAVVRAALSNPILLTEVTATVAGLTLEGTEDLCPTCRGDELGKVIRNMFPSGGKIAKTVLGRYPDYIDVADGLNANRFDIGRHWQDMIDQGLDPWKANQKFLDLAVERGDDIILARPFSQDDVGSYLEKEIKYLQETYGYRLSKDGTRIIAPE